MITTFNDPYNTTEVLQKLPEIAPLVEEVRRQNGHEIPLIGALNRVWLLLEKDEYKLPFLHPSLEFVPLLIHILQSDSYECIIQALKCLWFLSRAIPNRRLFGKAELGLIRELMKINLELVYPLRKHYSFLILVNISLCSSNLAYLLRDEVGFLEYYLIPLREFPPIHMIPYSFRLFGNLLNPSTFQDQFIPEITKFAIPQLIFQRLFVSGLNPATWQGRIGGIDYWALNFLMRLSYFPNGREVLVNDMPDCVQFLFTLMIRFPRELEGIKSFLLLSNLFQGSLPYSPEEALLERYPAFLPVIVRLLEATLDCFTEELRLEDGTLLTGYTFGIITIYKFMYSLMHLACHPKNRRIIIESCSAPLSLPCSPQSNTTSSVSSLFATPVKVIQPPRISPKKSSSRDNNSNHSAGPLTGLLLPHLSSFTPSKSILSSTSFSSTSHDILPNPNTNPNPNPSLAVPGALHSIPIPSFFSCLSRVLALFVENRSELSSRYDYTVFAGGGKDDHQSMESLLELLLLLSFGDPDLGEEKNDELKKRLSLQLIETKIWELLQKMKKIEEKEEKDGEEDDERMIIEGKEIGGKERVEKRLLTPRTKEMLRLIFT
jgi:hypothetical protein